jgi:hypothetical protein
MGFSSMNTLSRLALTVAVGAFTVPALADVPSAADVAAHNALVSSTRAQLAQAKAQAKALRVAPAVAPGAKALGQDTYPGSPTPNPYRAYPPSCAAYPLPDAPSGPSDQVYSTQMPFWTRDALGNILTPEVVTVTIWRIACSSGGSVTPYNSTGNFYNSMTFLRVDRSAANDGEDTYYPTLPLVQTNQGNLAWDNPASQIRIAAEPNTVVSDGAFDAPIYNSTTFVLENFNYSPAFYHEYNDAFTLSINPGLGGTNPGTVTFNIDAYNPTSTTYPDAFNPLPIDGYMSTSWYSPGHGGEGMQIQVYDGDANNRTFAAGWYAADSTGRPFWLLAQGTVPIGATSVQTTAYYTSGGGFGGSAGDATVAPWGTVTFSFPDCNHMHFTFNGQTDAATAGPSGSGTRDWIRVANTNGLGCE